MNLVVMTNRRFYSDDRKYLLRCVEAAGKTAVHVYCWETIEITVDDREVKRFPTTDIAAYDCIRALSGEGGSIVLTGLGGYVNDFVFRAKEFLPHSLFVYDVYDDLTYAATGLNLLQRIKWDMQWRSFCDLIMIKEEGIKRRYPNAFVLGNASHLRRLPKNDRSDPRRLIYAGSIDHRVDFDWLDRLVAKDVILDIYGWIHIDAPPEVRSSLESFIDKHKNVAYKGAYDDDDLPEILRHYSVGVIPYKKHHRMTKHLNPNKAYHYLNAGLEVIASPIPQMLRMEKYVHLAEAHDDFAGILNCISQSPKATTWPVECYTWEKRWAELLDIVTRSGSD